MRVAGVLGEGEDVVEAVLELVPDAVLRAVVLVEAVLAQVQAARDAAEGAALHGAEIGQELGADGPVALVVGQQREAGVPGGPPGQRRGQEEPVVVAVLHVQVGQPPDAGEGVAPRPVRRQRAAGVEGELPDVLRAGGQPHLAPRRVGRVALHHVDQPARRHLAVEHGGGAAQDLVALQPIGLEDTGRIARVEAQPVQELAGVGRLEAADLHPVGAGVEAVLLRPDAGGIAQRLAEILRLPLVDRVARHHRDGLRHLHQRRVGLAAGEVARGDIAVHRRQRVLAGALHAHRRQDGRAAGTAVTGLALARLGHRNRGADGKGHRDQGGRAEKAQQGPKRMSGGMRHGRGL